jgi:hypothetical protein
VRGLKNLAPVIKVIGVPEAEHDARSDLSSSERFRPSTTPHHKTGKEPLRQPPIDRRSQQEATVTVDRAEIAHAQPMCYPEELPRLSPIYSH